MGTALIDSSPPATDTSVAPVTTDWWAIARAWRPDAHRRLTVMPAVETGRPAPSATWRAMFRPWPPSGIAQPMTTSSTSAGSSPGARASASRTAAIPRESGAVSDSSPRGAFPTAVRAALTMTASRIVAPVSFGGACRS